jgi:hypothetical protein
MYISWRPVVAACAVMPTTGHRTVTVPTCATIHAVLWYHFAEAHISRGAESLCAVCYRFGRDWNACWLPVYSVLLLFGDHASLFCLGACARNVIPIHGCSQVGVPLVFPTYTYTLLLLPLPYVRYYKHVWSAQ